MTLPRPLLHAARITAAVLFWPALALVVWGELTPHAPLEGTEISDKVLHFIAYFGLAALAAAVPKSRSPAYLTTLFLIVLGGVLEIIQGMVGRDMSLYDEFANSAGALTGLALARMIVEPLRRRFG